MNIEFATCDRRRALEFLKRVYPSRTIEDTPECAKPLLDFVEADVVRIQDPMMYGNKIAIVPGNKWDEAKRAEVHAVAVKLHAGDDAIAKATG